MEGSRILIVEDEGVVAIDLRNRLRYLGYEVAGMANTAEVAIQEAAELRPDLVLLDIMLKKEGDGIEAAARIRSEFGIPVVYLTAYSDESTLERAKATEPYGYIIKPFEDRDLQATLAMALSKHRMEKELRASEIKYRNLFARANDAILLMDEQVFIDCNEKTLEMFACTREQILGHPPYEFSPPRQPDGRDSTQKAMEKVQTALKGEPQFFGWRHTRADGSPFDAEVSLNVLSINGKTHIQAIVRDVSERQRALERFTRLNDCFLSFGSRPLDNINRLVAHCGKMLGATRALYNRLERGKLHSLALWNTPSDFQSVVVPEGHICYDVICKDQGEVQIFHNLLDTPYAQSDSNVRAYGLKTYLGKAIRLRSQPVGSLCAVFQEDFQPAEVDLQLMNVIASAIGIEEERRYAEEELVKLRLGVENSEEAIFITDVNGNIVQVNPAFERIYGYNRAETLGKTPRLLKSGLLGSESYAQFWDTLLHKQTVKCELINKTKDGRLITVEATANPILNEDGQIIGFMGIQHDITKRREIEESLKTNEKFLSSVFASIQDGISILDMDMRIVRVNTKMQDWYAHAQPLEGKKCYEAYHGATKPCAVCPVRQTLKTQKTAHEIVPLTGVDRTVHGWLDLFSFPLLDETTGQLKGVIEYVRDITDMKRTQEALRESEEHFRSLFENSTIGLYRTTPQGEIVMANPALLRMLGFASFEELKQRNLEKDGFAAVRERNLFKERIHQDGMIRGLEYVWTRGDGSPVHIRESAKAIRDTDGALLYYEGTVEDISDGKNAELVRDMLYQIGEDVSTAENLDDLLSSIHARIKKAVYAENCYIALYDAEAELVKFPFFVDQCDPRPEPRVKHKGFTEYVLHTGKPLLLTPDLYQELVQSGQVEPTGTPPVSWLGVPLFIDGKSYGVLVVQSYEAGHVYGAYEKDLLAAIGHQAAMAIERKRKNDALRQSEEKYRMLIDNIQDGVFIVQDGGFLFANGAFARAVGYSIEELIGLEMKHVIAPEDWDWISDLYRRLLAGETPPGDFEVHGLHRDGVSRIIANLSLGMIQYRGRPAAMGTIKDITERKQAEKERELIQKINQLLLGELDAERALNGISSELLEFIPHETIAMSLIQKDSDQVEYIISAVRSGAHAGKEQHPNHYFEPYANSLTQQILFDKREAIQHDLAFGMSRFERHLSDLRMKSYIAVPLFNVGVPLGMLFLASARPHAFLAKHEQLLQQIQSQLALYIQHQRIIERMFDSEAKYRSLFENSNDIIYILQDRRFIFINRKFEEVLGYNLEEVSRSDFNFMNLVAPESVPLIEERARRLAQGEKLLSRYEFKGLSKAGKEIEFEANVSYISYDGKTATQGILRDISDRRRFEAQQQELQLELIQRAKLSSIGMLSAGIAHNMNLPLQGIINHIELLKMTRSDVPYLDDILNQAQRIAAIINNMLFKSRQEQDQGLRELDLNQLLVEELTFLNADLDFKHRVVKEYHFDPELPKIQGVYGDFSQAILNIIRNALDAMHESREKRLIVRTEAKPDKEILIEVTDTGCGIEPDHLDQIFSPFFTTKPMAGKQRGSEPAGTGLGLSSAYQLMKKYHARYDVQSRPEEGTVFRIYIPTSRPLVPVSVAELAEEQG